MGGEGGHRAYVGRPTPELSWTRHWRISFSRSRTLGGLPHKQGEINCRITRQNSNIKPHFISKFRNADSVFHEAL